MPAVGRPWPSDDNDDDDDDDDDGDDADQEWPRRRFLDLSTSRCHSNPTTASTPLSPLMKVKNVLFRAERVDNGRKHHLIQCVVFLPMKPL